MSPPTPTAVYGGRTVMGILAADGRFDVIIARFEAVEVIEGPVGAAQVLASAADVASRPGWDHTLFAPTDEAFAALDHSTVDCLFDRANATRSLRVHVVPELLPSDRFATGQVVTIGGPVPMRVDGRHAMFAGGEIVETTSRRPTASSMSSQP